METDSTKTYYCPYCEKSFKHLGYWQDHVRVHTGEKPFKCPNCSYAARREKELKNHLEARKILVEQCSHCDFTSCTHQALLNHRKESHAEEPTGIAAVAVSVLAQTTEQEIRWKVNTGEQNQATILPNRISAEVVTKCPAVQPKAFSENPNLLSCSRCRFSCLDSSKFMEHIRARCEGAPFHCHLCTFKSSSSARLMEHRHQVHMSLDVNSSIRSEVIKTKTVSKTSLVAKQVKRKYMHNCKYCNKALNSKSHLDEHIRTHTGERPFKCYRCCYSAKTKYALTMHSKTSSDFPHKCLHCKLKFCHTNILQSHAKECHPVAWLRMKKSGSGAKTPLPKERKKVGQTDRPVLTKIVAERPGGGGKKFEMPKRFKCRFCDYRSSTRRNTEVHERTHTGEKPYECKDCGQRFTQLGNLQQHKARWH